MEIYIDGQQLHINDGDVAIQWDNLRFSEAVADEWSTEIDIANDSGNIDVLNAYGLLDRTNMFNHRVHCSVLIGEISRDGYLQVTSIEENVIHIRVFLISIPYGILDKKVSEYYPVNDVIFRWDRYSPISTNIAGTDVGIFEYTYAEKDFYSNILAQWHSSVSVQKILSLIQTEEDITLPTVDNTLYELSARKKVCPSNPRQVMMGFLEHSNAITDQNLELCAGQHITNDAKTSWTYSDLVWDPNWSSWDFQQTNLRWLQTADKTDTITYNRHCSAHIKVYASANIVGGILIPKKNGVSLAPAAASNVPALASAPWSTSDILLFDDYVAFEDGDILTFHYSGSAQLPDPRRIQYSIVIEYDSYDWDEDDYDVDLEYVPAPFMIWCLLTSGGVTTYDYLANFTGDGDGTQNEADYSFTYFGAYTNLDREMSVRDLLTSLCWIHNRKLRLDKNELIFQPATMSREITANILSIAPSSDKLGQTNKIGYRQLEEGKYDIEFDIDNEYLDNEVALHTSQFYTADVMPQYSYEMTYTEDGTVNGSPWIEDIKVNFEDLGAVIMTAESDGTKYTLKRAPDILGLGLPALTSALTITAETIGRISDLDYVYVDGHKYMLVEGSYDPDTDITEFTAIQVYNQGREYEPTVNVYITAINDIRVDSAKITIRINES